MFKYELSQKVFAVHKNKIKKGKIIGRKNVENLSGNHDIYGFGFDDSGIYYRVLFENSNLWDYEEQSVFNSIEECIEYISK